MDIRYRDDSYVMARPSGQALFHSGLAAAPRNPVPGFRRSGDDPSCCRPLAGMTRNAHSREVLGIGGDRGFHPSRGSVGISALIPAKGERVCERFPRTGRAQYRAPLATAPHSG
jgi:hypothetical protein